MADAETTTTRELEITLHQVQDGSGEQGTKTISISDPLTSAAGLSAINDFCDFLLTDNTVQAGLNPAMFFQPTGWASGSGSVWITKATSAKIVETTKTVTTIR